MTNVLVNEHAHYRLAPETVVLPSRGYRARIDEPDSVGAVRVVNLASWTMVSRPPSQEEVVSKINQLMRVLDISADRRVESEDGGVVYWFFGGPKLPGGASEKYASIEASDSGEVVVLHGYRSDRAATKAWDISATDESIEKALVGLMAFVRP
jgi:hypothetical protein